MFSILNEIKDNSPGSVVTVIGSSIGSAASVYILVAITGYLTFGSDVKGNIVGMCTWRLLHPPFPDEMCCPPTANPTHQIPHPSPRPSPRQPSLRSSPSASRCRFTPAAPRSTPSSAGARVAVSGPRARPAPPQAASRFFPRPAPPPPWSTVTARPLSPCRSSASPSSPAPSWC